MRRNYNFSFTNSATVSRCTPKIRAIADLETFLSNKFLISISLPVSFLIFDLLPFGAFATTAYRMQFVFSNNLLNKSKVFRAVNLNLQPIGLARNLHIRKICAKV